MRETNLEACANIPNLTYFIAIGIYVLMTSDPIQQSLLYACIIYNSDFFMKSNVIFNFVYFFLLGKVCKDSLPFTAYIHIHTSL